MVVLVEIGNAAGGLIATDKELRVVQCACDNDRYITPKTQFTSLNKFSNGKITNIT